MMNKQYFYNLDDFYSQDQGGNWKTGGSENVFHTLLTNYGLAISSLAYGSYSSTYQAIIDALFVIIRDYYKSDYCFVAKYQLHESELPLSYTQCKDLLGNFVNVFNMTLGRYLPLLKAYQDNESTPIQKISSESSGKTRFNDTPQGDDINGEYYSDDTHATNVTAALTITSTDPAAIYEQLDRLFKNWRSIIKDWVNEFDGLFTNGVNLI